MIADNAIYVDGRRAAQQPSSLQETYEALRQLDDGVAWIDLYKPTQEEFESVARELELPRRVIEGAIKPQQRPKLVRYGNSLFVVLETARYLDEPEKVEFSEVHVLVGKDFVVTVRYEEIPALEEVRRRLEGEPELLRQGPQPILREIMDQIVDDYEPVLEGLGTDIQEVEVEVFGGNSDVSQRIYELSRELVQFQRATSPLARSLERGAERNEHDIDPELRSYLRELYDRVLRVEEPTEGFRDMLSEILVVNLTPISVRQNDPRVRRAIDSHTSDCMSRLDLSTSKYKVPRSSRLDRVPVFRAPGGVWHLSQAPASAGILPDFTAAQRAAWSLSVWSA